MTIVLPVTDLTVEDANLSKHDLHLYFLYLFEYGMKNILELISLKISFQMSDEIKNLFRNFTLLLFRQ